MFHLNNILGKLLTLAIIMIAAHYHILAGVVAVLVFISLTNYTIEGMENKEDTDKVESDSESDSEKKPSKDSAIQQFRTKHCVDGKLMKDDNEVTPQQLKDAFPDINFSSDACNPCDEDCNFEIISSSEKLTVEENLKSIDSTNIPVDRQTVTAKSE